MIKIYDDTLTLLGVINNYSKLQFKSELRNKGAFTINIAKNKTGVEHLDVGNIISLDADTSGIIVEKRTRQNANGEYVEVKGTALLGILNRRITRDYDLSMVSESIAKHVVNTSMVNATDTDRNISILSIATDGANGTTHEFVSLNEPLIKALERPLSVDGYGHKITLESTGLVYDVIVPVDRTDSVQFSNKIHNLREAERVESDANYRTVVYIDGIGASGVYGSATGLDRREVYVKDSNTNDINDRALQELNGKYYKTSAISGRIRITGNPFEYKTDYNLGDYVTVIYDGQIYEVQITQATETYDTNGYNLDLVFGTQTRDFADLITDIKESER